MDIKITATVSKRLLEVQEDLLDSDLDADQ